MKIKDLIKKLQLENPEAELVSSIDLSYHGSWQQIIKVQRINKEIVIIVHT